MADWDAFRKAIEDRRIKDGYYPDADKFIGKTIKSCSFTTHQVFILFTDDTFVNADLCGDDPEDIEIGYNVPMDAHALLSCGLIDWDTFKQMNKDEKEAKAASELKKKREQLEALKKELGEA